MKIPYHNPHNSSDLEENLAAAPGHGDAQRPMAGARLDADCPEQLPDTQEGAPPSNTAPSNRIKGSHNSRVLRTGVDSLYLSYAGELKPEVEELLENLKQCAQSNDPLERAEAIYCLADHRFEVKGNGARHYPFVLQDGVFHLQLSRAAASSMPMIYAQIGSEALTRTGVEYTEIALHNLASVVGSKLKPATVSRVDLCVDFVTDCDLSTIPRSAWVNRAVKHSTYEDRGRFSGLTFGMGGALSARLYDKTLEILRSNKTYLYEIWRGAGWNGESPVWRLEYQFGRQSLHDFGISAVGDLLTRRADLWAYAMHWLRLVVPSTTDKSKDRWPNHPLWDLLTGAAWGVERGEPLTRSRKTRPPSDKYLFVNGTGAITSFMAREGIADFDEGLERYRCAVHAYHLEESRRSGKTLTTYAREKAIEKARRFNTVLDPANLKRGAE